MPDIPGRQLPHVLTGAGLRERIAALPRWLHGLVIPGLLRRASKVWMPLGKTVVIIGADLAAVELAEFIARRGRRVHLLETGGRIAPEVGKKRRAEHMDRLDNLQVTLNTRVEILGIEPAGTRIRSCNGTERLIAADHVIIAGTPQPDTGLAEQLASAGFRVERIGDCTGLGLIAAATRTATESVARLTDGEHAA